VVPPPRDCEDATEYADAPLRGVARGVVPGRADVTLVLRDVACDATLRAVVLDADGAPLPGARVSVPRHVGPPAEAVADKEGRVVVEGLPRWPCQARVEPPSDRGPESARPLAGRAVHPGDPSLPFVVRLSPAPPTVRGRVVDAEGRPVAKAWGAVYRGAETVSCFESDAEGRFAVAADVPAGSRVQVWVRHPAQRSTSVAVAEGVVAGGGEATVAVRRYRSDEDAANDPALFVVHVGAEFRIRPGYAPRPR
jgi:hypothetical protein